MVPERNMSQKYKGKQKKQRLMKNQRIRHFDKESGHHNQRLSEVFVSQNQGVFQLVKRESPLES